MSLNPIVVTNNPDLDDIKLDQIRVCGDYEAVLLKARDMVHQGYSLLSHPLNASSRMLLSPYRSIVLTKKALPLSQDSLLSIENSIITYRNMTAKRSIDNDNAEDYAMVDKRLLLSTLNELSLLSER